MEKIKTISNDSEAEIIEKKSKFIANLYYVNSIEDNMVVISYQLCQLTYME